MRLFVAVDPPDEAADSLRAALPADDRLRWSAPEHWHLTLAFLGEVAAPALPELSDRLARAAGRSAPVRLRLAGAGHFGRQVLWIGVDGDTAALARLADRCAAAARRSGIPMEERRFRPHLTVARARGRGADLRGAADALSAYAGPWWVAADVRLVRSHLGPPLVHETLATLALTGPPAAGAGTGA